LSEHFSLGIGFRFIYSNLAGAFQQTQNSIKAGLSYAGDIDAYYRNKFRLKGYKVDYGIGAAITNIGAKITYSSAQYANFIPTNLRVGGYFNHEIDKYNSIALVLDFNKLLVPSPPIYYGSILHPGYDSLAYYPDGPKVIAKGKDPNVPVVQGMVQSLYDAPGGIKEELQEINISTGAEYWYDKQFALRAGYFHEPVKKGGRQYVTLGLGLRYNVFGLDVSYLWPIQLHNPLEKTLRFTLVFDFDAFISQQKEEKKKNKNVSVTPTE
jgi:hypothetical protein